MWHPRFGLEVPSRCSSKQHPSGRESNGACRWAAAERHALPTHTVAHDAQPPGRPTGLERRL